MIIKDAQKLLPNTIDKNLLIPNMVLEVPPHGIPLHAKSIERILATVQSDKKVVIFQPTLPVASELGLPSYPPLAYLYPQELSDIFSQFRQRFESKNQANLLGSIGFNIISETSIEEQLHYFADHYGIAVKPSYVRVIVGNTCNLKCVMCPYHSPALKSTHTTDFFTGNKVMPWKTMERLARECGEQGIAIVIGNVEEPMLHPNIVDFVQLCRQKGVPKVHITTNGQLLDERRAKALLEAGITSIDISIDAADANTYWEVRGGNLRRVESNIINFIQIREQLGVSCEVRTSFVRNQNVTLEEEEKFRQRWLKQTDAVCILNLAEYKEANMHLDRINNTVQDYIKYYIEKANGRWSCLFPFTEMAVLPDGRIYYCIETLFRLGFDKDIVSLGDYNTETLQNIWRGNLFNQLRHDLIINNLSNRLVCKSCEMWMSQVVYRYVKNNLQVTSTMVTEIYQKSFPKRI
ncbi:radical SAM protein [Aetokthonos hydrillicola Thurmond2011]|jgi:MoaA/NifB/PqqE/SkfB family radical SAM enzyme|uniref:Radical SAM protein n=1 Tax=Aetokthonos hydrillicola Thurmond2011 TaxID=2712845 RepID=A0AAP5I4Y2_9CYAN|nr:radical SAM protein [Aetokthonos hydrillicola]MBO3459797.1 radical SAM protein [Aetokthonos hydrillicola CCALA 1050]MBW4584558.1 radical SAM protein [Aetokthonos hydrillicola CCALA 1050]MDR9895102.1 radical SAM protein [Aetokthonos hydrillicola Thurmond2011]